MTSLAEFLVVLEEHFPDPTVRGKKFEPFLRDALLVSPSHQFVNVWCWEDWPGRDGPDRGIDLVAEHVDGGLWGVQSKLYSADSSLTWDDLSTWVGTTRKAPWTRRLLVSTSSKLAPNAQKELLGDPATSLLLGDELFSLPVEWPNELASPVSRRAPLIPLPHQVDAIDAIVGGFEAGAARLQTHMACGTGKTTVGRRVYERLEPDLAVVLVPSLSLMAQTIRSWAANTANEFRYLPVCSDTKVAEDRRPGEDVDLDVDDLAVLDSQATTDAEQIVSFLNLDQPRVVFCTYQSSDVLSSAAEAADVEFDLVIADEAHRTTGSKSTVFSTVLNDKVFPAKRRLFMTATPKTFTAAADGDETVHSMDDTAVYGDVAHELGFGKAVELGLLADYEVVVVAVDDPALRETILAGGSVELNGLNKAVEASALVALEGSLQAIERFDMKRLISFHSRIRRAKDFAAAVPVFADWRGRHMTVEANTVDGSMNASERSRHISWLEKGDRPRVLTNARCLTEGIDVPSLDGIVFADPRRSQVDIVQAVGRVMRTNPNDADKVGRIIIPLVVPDPDGVDGDNVFEGSAFKPVWDVIRALKAHDFRLESELNRLRRLSALGPVNDREFRESTRINIIGVDDLAEFQLAVVNRVTPNFWWWVAGPLQQHIDREGTALVPFYHLEPFDGRDVKLGKWVNKCRTSSQRGELSAEHFDALDTLPGWEWDAVEAEYQRNLQALRQYVAREGNARVPYGHVEPFDGEDIKLGLWANSRRSDRRAEKLSDERAAELDDLPGWEWDPREAAYQRHFQALLQYVAREGHSQISKSHAEPFDGEDFKIGLWVTRRRSEHNNKTLSAERTAALDSIADWEWDLREAAFQQNFQALLQYVDREGTAHVHDDHVEPFGGEDVKLGKWVGKRRAEHRKGNLSAERAAALGGLPGWEEDPLEANYQRGLRAARQYAEREGHALVPSDHVEPLDGEDFNLGNWISSRRSERSRGTLSDERTADLKALPGWKWAAPKARLGNKNLSELSLKALLQYVDREGHARVPFSHKEPYKGTSINLGSWANSRRTDRRNKKLSDELESTLGHLPGWEWNPKEDDYQRRFQALLQYVDREGHARVPPSHKEPFDGEHIKIGTWVGSRRLDRRKGTLSKERETQLGQLPGWEWEPDEADYQRGLQAVRQYVGRNGHARVPALHKEPFDGAELHLGSWVRNCRVAHKNKQLSSERFKDLDGLPGWEWEIRKNLSD